MRDRSRREAEAQIAQTEDVGEDVVPSLQHRLGNQRLLQYRKAFQCQNGDSAPDWIKAQLGLPTTETPAPRVEEPPMPAGGQALPEGLQHEAERELGVGLGGVTIATRADQACDAMGALAFTTPTEGGGQTIALSSSVDLASDDGRFTLLHELAHVAQQRRGETDALSGLGGDEATRASLEADADAVAASSTLLRRRR